MRTQGWREETKGDKILQEFEKQRPEENKPQKVQTTLKIPYLVNRY